MIKKIILFFVILAGIAWTANSLLVTNNRKYERADTPLADQSEVIFIGTSQGFNDINPQILWDEYGIASYNYATQGQHLGITYYYLKDILNYQTPKVIVLDAECASRPEDFLTESNKLYSFTEIKDLRLHHQMYRDFFDGNPAYEIPLLRYHNRWKEISVKDFRKEHYILGAQMRRDISHNFTEPPTPLEVSLNGEALGQREELYLNQIADLAAESGIPLVILDLPCYDTPETAALSLATENWAENRGLSSIMMNSKEVSDELNLDSQDFSDNMHLNIHGANKVSTYLGTWLTNQYGLGGHKGDPGYDSFESRMDAPRTLVNSDLMMMEKEMIPYFDYLSHGQYTIALSLTGDYKKEAGRISEALALLGIQIEPGVTGSWVIENGTIVFSSGSLKDYLFGRRIGQDDLTVRGTSQNGERIELLHAQTNLAQVPDGINLIVFNNVTKTRLDVVGFDAADGCGMVR